jgi:hypothetical protein
MPVAESASEGDCNEDARSQKEVGLMVANAEAACATWT